LLGAEKASGMLACTFASRRKRSIDDGDCNIGTIVNKLKELELIHDGV
jgi:hypothetical protein